MFSPGVEQSTLFVQAPYCQKFPMVVTARVESYLIGRSGSEKLHRFKGEWSPKIAKDLYCLLSKKRIK